MNTLNKIENINKIHKLPKLPRYMKSYFAQCWICIKRISRFYWRSPSMVLSRLFISLLIGLSMGLMYLKVYFSIYFKQNSLIK